MQRPPFVAFRLNEEELNFVERMFEEYQVRDKMEMGKVGGSNNWGNQQGGQNDQIRRSNIHFMKAVGPMKEFIWTKFSNVNRDHYGFDISDVFDIQYSEYDESYKGHYDWHPDIMWNTTQAYHRKLSMSIQLSHFYEYEGGILELDGIDTSNPEFKQKGTAICFPSYHTHRVTPVTKGNRKALVTWCEGPLLR